MAFIVAFLRDRIAWSSLREHINWSVLTRSGVDGDVASPTRIHRAAGSSGSERETGLCVGTNAGFGVRSRAGTGIVILFYERARSHLVGGRFIGGVIRIVCTWAWRVLPGVETLLAMSGSVFTKIYEFESRWPNQILNLRFGIRI